MKLLSFCTPLYNEEKILLSFLPKIQKGLDRMIGKNRYEIILIDNGSTDETPTLLKHISDKRIRIFSLKDKGLGLAYKKGIYEAHGKFVLLSAIDLPFGFSDIMQAIKIWDKYDLIFGSKAHAKSQIYVSWERAIISSVYRFLLKLFFSVSIKDTQGSVILNKKRIAPILGECNAKNAFFTAQLAIYGRRKGLLMTEVPVVFDKENVNVRSTRFNLITEGRLIFFEMLKNYFLFQRVK